MAKISINIKSGSIGAAEDKDIVVGIDLGTTNSLVAWVNPESQKPEIITNSSELLVPSVLYFEKNGEITVGSVAKAKLSEDPENTIFSVKRLLGKSYKDIENPQQQFAYKIIDENTDDLVKIGINGKYYNPIELSSYILQELKSRAEFKLNRKVSKAVITVPAYFNDAQRQATKDAGKLAGLEVLRIINEPTAASLAYGLENRTHEKNVLVYDLGGGTFDVSILRIENGFFEVLSTHGDTNLGGDDIDRSIVNFWSEKYNLGFLTPVESSQLKWLAENAKKQLAADSQVQLALKLQEVLTVELNEIELEAICSDIIQKTMLSVQSALNDAQMAYSDIDEVVLVGGSTRLKWVMKKLGEKFGAEKIKMELNPDEVVALGAAIEADILAGNRKDVLLLDVTPLSLGIETQGGLMDVLVPRNSKIPASVARQYTTSVDGQLNILLNVYQGERELVSENRKLATFTLQNIPAMPAGLPKIEVKFLIDANGILRVMASELRSNKTAEITVEPKYGLKDEDVETMLLNSLQYAKEDIEKRLLIEATNEAQQLSYMSKSFIEKNKELLSESEIAQTEKFILELEKAMLEKRKDVILQKVEQLNEFTRPFAERVMDAAIAKAMTGKKISETKI